MVGSLSLRCLVAGSVLLFLGCTPLGDAPPDQDPGVAGHGSDDPGSGGGPTSSVVASPGATGGLGSSLGPGAGVGTGGVELGPATELFFQGIKFPLASSEEWELLRFPLELYEGKESLSGFNPLRARTTAGAALVFETTSPTVAVEFRYHQGDEHRWGAFGISQDGGPLETVNAPKDDQTTHLSIVSDTPGSLVRYRVVLPPWSNPILTAITLEDGHQLESFRPEKKGAYVALGDSLTHGTGQAGSFEGYAWQTAETLDLELFNLAVGGAKVSLPIAESLANWPELTLVSIMIGYNDWMNEGKSKQEFKDALVALVDSVRGHHPLVPVVFLNILDSDKATSNRTGLPVSDFRAAIEEVVTQRVEAGDANLHLAPAETWVNNTSDLADGIHLNPVGATKFSQSFTSYLRLQLGW